MIVNSEHGVPRPQDVIATGCALPVVSVIIPVKNDAARLAVCLASLQRQTYSADRFEIIVVDNGSSDDSCDVAGQYGAQVLHLPKLRVGALRNAGVEQASGDILAFVDSDHELPATWIQSGAMELQSHPEIKAVGAPCLAPPNGTWVQRTWQKHRLRRQERGSVRWLGAGNMFVRRSEFDAIGGFNEDLIAAEDVDLCLRLAPLPGDIVSDPRIENVHHGEPATVWRLFWKEYWRGSSGVRAFFAQRMPWAELPSLLYPTYHLLAAIGLVTTLVGWIWTGTLLPFLIVLVMFPLPALILAAKISCQIGQFTALPGLALLYMTYGLARAGALFRG